MWNEAITAVKQDDISWIENNRRQFGNFFRNENLNAQGHLKESALAYHYQHKLFKMFLEKSLEGLALDLQTGARWIENAARLNGSWGWLLGIGVGGAYFSHYLPETVRMKFFFPKEALIAGSGKPAGEVVKKGNKWLLNGSWDYCSGSEQASLFTGVTRKDGEISAFILPISKVEIERNWDAIGLDLTCSHRITVVNAEIEEDFFFDLSGQPFSSGYPLSSYSFDLFARACFVPVVTGIATSLWKEVELLRDRKKQIWQQFQPEKYHKIQNTIAEFERSFDDLRNNFYEALTRSWESHLKGKNMNGQGLQKVSLELSAWCYNSSSAIMPLLGMEVVKADHPLQKCWKDLQTAYQHMIFRDFN